MTDFAALRRAMVEDQLVARGVRDPRVLAAMGEVPREAFVPEAVRDRAYEDGPLPIGEGQTISQPLIVALMAEAAQIDPGDRILDVGTGSGYAAAVLARLGRFVWSIERIATLAERARAALAGLGLDNVEVVCGDGSLGWAPQAPYDVIHVAASGPGVPAALERQLAIGGRLVMPVGPRGEGQRLVRVRRTAEGRWERDDLGGVAFVPLIGAGGW
jgi:protein-L-isoaspartate(D-aspartate) O-methyltransferase